MTTISLTDAAVICGADAMSVSTNKKEFVEQNSMPYCVLINTWAMQFETISPELARQFVRHIRMNGLLPTIAMCNSAAASVISGAPELPVWMQWCQRDLTDIDTVLQLLRYGKRFSPLGADKLQAASLQDFLALNNKVKLSQRYEYSWFLIKRVAYQVHLIVKGFSPNYDNGSFSTGVGADTRRPLAAKIAAYGNVVPNFRGIQYPLASSPYCDEMPYIDNGRCCIPATGYIAKIYAVPKSYKTARIIAAEHSYRQFHMQALRVELERVIRVNGFEGYLDLHDQEQNQELCRYGALFGNYATIDLSSASDSLSRSLARELFPAAVFDEFARWLPTGFVIPDGRKYTMQMFCTSGSALTFPVESIVFLAIALAVGDLYRSFGSDPKPPHIFGDDMVVDTETFDTTCEVLSALGFTVNADKSFATGIYRESCGKEYAGVVDTTTMYFPRRPLDFSKDGLPTTIESLVALQHRSHEIILNGHRSWEIPAYLSDVVRKFFPKMTSSMPGTECDDLWEIVPIFDTVLPPHSKGAEVPQNITRERHATLVAAPRGKAKERDMRLLDMYRYVKFLQHGPRYATPLDALLKCSEPWPAYDVDATGTTSCYKLIRR